MIIPQQCCARYTNVNNHYITFLGVYNWSLFYSSYFSVLPYFVQWIYISFIIREKRDTWKKRYWITGHFSLGSDHWGNIAYSAHWHGGSQWSFCLTIPWQEVDQFMVAGIFQVTDTIWFSGLCRPEAFGISEPTISILDSGTLSLCCS